MSNAMCLEMKSKFGLIIFNPFVSIVYVSDSSHLFFFSFRQKFMKIFAIRTMIFIQIQWSGILKEYRKRDFLNKYDCHGVDGRSCIHRRDSVLGLSIQNKRKGTLENGIILMSIIVCLQSKVELNG